MKRVGVIDIGTNSVKLLIADVAPDQVDAVLEDSEQTRLGRGFYETHILQKGAIAQTAEAVATFKKKAVNEGAQSIRVIATSAARDAKNPSDLLAAIRNAGGLEVEIISGEQEADWAFRGVISNPDFARDPLLILDVGGGSTEFIIGEHGHQHFRESFDLGTVRMLEKLPHSDPPTGAELQMCRQWLQDFIAEKIAPKVIPALTACCSREVQLVGTGGTSTILARMVQNLDSYDREVIESTRINRERIGTIVERIWSLPLAQRQTLSGLPPKRADVILTGAVIYEAVLQQLGFSQLRVSTRGLRFGAAMAMS